MKALVYDPTGTRLASAGWYDEIVIRDTAGRELVTLPKSGFVSSLAFSPDGQLLAAGSGRQGVVHIWNVDSKQIIQNYLLGHDPPDVEFLPNGELLAGLDERLMRRDVNPRPQPAAQQSSFPSSEETSIAISPAGDLLVAGYGRYEADPGEGAIACWDLRHGTHRLLPGHDGTSVMDVAIDPTGEVIVACGGPRYGPGFVKLWDARTGTSLPDLPKQKTVVCGIAISPTGDRLAAATVGPGGTVSMWPGVASQPEPLWIRDIERAFRVAFSPDGDSLAVGRFDVEFARKNLSTVMILDAQSPDHFESASLERAIMELAFSPDGRLVASIDFGGKVEVYDRQQQRTVLSELAHRWVGYGVAFSPDGRTLATGSSSGDIKLWHLPAMMHVTTLSTRRGLTELAFFPDGKTLAVGFTDHIVELWHVDREIEKLNIDDGTIN